MWNVIGCILLIPFVALVIGIMWALYTAPKDVTDKIDKTEKPLFPWLHLK